MQFIPGLISHLAIRKKALVPVALLAAIAGLAIGHVAFTMYDLPGQYAMLTGRSMRWAGSSTVTG